MSLHKLACTLKGSFLASIANLNLTTWRRVVFIEKISIIALLDCWINYLIPTNNTFSERLATKWMSLWEENNRHNFHSVMKLLNCYKKYNLKGILCNSILLQFSKSTNTHLKDLYLNHHVSSWIRSSISATKSTSLQTNLIK